MAKRHNPRERCNAAHADLQYIPILRCVGDVEALEHARLCVRHAMDTAPEHPMASRALSELDRLIDQARRAK